ncbi:MAG TPA: VWA domain-containing protein [Candidatus Eremiobacteraceae bacterium]|nr:VWA domain-containing protein [Candidatus Eremiobacteraceae bacterium]
MTTASPQRPPEPAEFAQLPRNVVLFGRALRANGFRAQPDRMLLLAQALDAVGLARREDVKAAARTVLTRNAEERDRFDAAFDCFWSARFTAPPPAGAREQQQVKARSDRREDADPDKTSETVSVASNAAPPGSDAAPETHDLARALEGDRSYTYSFAEGLYRKDFARLSVMELDRARELTKRQFWDLGRRLTRRMRKGQGRGAFDPARTLRASLRRGGEMLSLATRERKTKQRDLVLLCDISGSMDRYSRLLLQFVHTVRHAVGNVEAFVFGTRLTRITRQLRHREIQAALDDVSTNVADWAGGTRIGESLHAFNRTWARRVLGRGAIVVIISDGWDRGDVEMLGREMERLQASSFRLIWLNPLLGGAGYRPQTIGMRAALPYVDDFLPANNLQSLVQLAQLLRSVEHRRPVRKQRHA